MANVLRLRRTSEGGRNREERVDPRSLPDPRPAAAGAFREMIDRGRLTYEEIAEAALLTMGVTIQVDVIARWHDGLGFPPSYVWLLVRWLSSASAEVMPTLVPPT